MARLVDDLLDVSRLRRGAIELRRERFELSDAVARALEMTSAVFSEKQHRLDVEVPPDLEIHADRVRMAQVLSNLLSNAAKYSEPGAHILLRAHKENDHVVIECRDTGIGIAADLVPHVFDIFVQGQRGLDRRQGGLGLGLAVARTLVELHGGTIEALSAGSGQGSTFIVRLPLAPTPPPASPGIAQEPSIAATPQPRIGRVMVVDDNRDALDMLVEALKGAGVEAPLVPGAKDWVHPYFMYIGLASSVLGPDGLAAVRRGERQLTDPDVAAAVPGVEAEVGAGTVTPSAGARRLLSRLRLETDP
jgi:hypothetical protein